MNSLRYRRATLSLFCSGVSRSYGCKVSTDVKYYQDKQVSRVPCPAVKAEIWIGKYDENYPYADIRLCKSRPQLVKYQV